MQTVKSGKPLDFYNTGAKEKAMLGGKRHIEGLTSALEYFRRV